MSESIENRKVYSLSDITRSIEAVIHKAYKANSYWIKAEMVKLNHYPKSGHCYPDLAEKLDGKLVAQLRAIIWQDDYQTQGLGSNPYVHWFWGDSMQIPPWQDYWQERIEAIYKPLYENRQEERIND